MHKGITDWQRKQGKLLIACMVAAALLIASPVLSDDIFPLPEVEQSDPDEVTEEDLQRFAVALATIQQVEVQANQYIEDIIDESELSEQRLQEILQMQQLDPIDVEDEVSSSELEEFEQAIEEVSAVHEAAHEQITETIEELGFDLEAFNQLAETIQNDPELMGQLQQMFMN